MRIEKLTVYQLRIPLIIPYRLAFGVIRAFDTILVEASNQDGAVGFGEATLLTGYTDETIDDSWQIACTLAQQVIGSDFQRAKEKIDQLYLTAPFTVTAFTTALEMIEEHPMLQIMQSEPVPILGLVHGDTPAELEADIEQQLEQGYRTLKVKVGFDAEADLKRIHLIQRILEQRGQIRLDANQGYSREDAAWFASRLEPDGIELFEQPCAADDWEGACAVARISNVPMMLDESIYGLADIARAAELKAAAFIKLKLMKMGGLNRLTKGLQFVRECGMEPVLGNGVASDIGCWMEACVARGFINNAGEMNGFLKPNIRLLKNSIEFSRGSILLGPDFKPSLNRVALSQCLQKYDNFFV